MQRNCTTTTAHSPAKAGVSGAYASTLPGPLHNGQAKVVLLTGATGFVGKRLLEELLKQRDCTVVCPIRADSELEAQRRGRAISTNLRAVYLRADLESPRLGLNADTWDHLAGRLQEIYHCAASVSFDLSLDDARKINVEGTRRLLELARCSKLKGGFKRFHHVSTAYVAGRKSGPVDASFLPKDSHRAFRNNYERSKAEAERLLRDQTDVAVSIYRPSIVCGETTSGATDNFNVLYVPMRLISRGSMPRLLKSGAGHVDCVGVDYVVRGIVALADAATSRIDNFHLTAGKSFSINDMARIAVEETAAAEPGSAANCEIVSIVRWRGLGWAAAFAAVLPASFKHTRRWGKIVQRGLRNFKPYEPYCSVNTSFVCAREAQLLKASDITQPSALEYLRTITRFAIESGFGAESSGPSNSTSTATNNTSETASGKSLLDTSIDSLKDNAAAAGRA